AGTDGPFRAAEVRHLGEATARDVVGGSAVGVRGARSSFALFGATPTAFATVLPDAEARVVSDLAGWLSPESNGNFAPHPSVRRAGSPGATPAVDAKLVDLRR